MLALLLFAATPELIILNARMPGASAVVITAGKIERVTNDAEAHALAGKDTRVIDAEQRLLLPGLIDSHIHFVSGGMSAKRFNVGDCKSLEAIQARVKAYAAAHPELPWIVGYGFSYDMFAPKLPTRQMLDAAVSDRPVFMHSYDDHTGWVNSRALALAGMSQGTGALVEDAMDAVLAKLPPASQQERMEAILAAQKRAFEVGLTAINDFAGDTETLDAYLALEKEGRLQIRVFYSPPLETPLPQLTEMRDRIGKASKRIKFGSLKGYVDGVVESNTAAFIAPYADDPKMTGEAHLKPADLERLIVPADKAGFTVSLHAIGDLGVRTSLDAYALAAQKNGSKDRRHRIEHIEVVDPADVRRFKALGVVASMQPLHAEPTDVFSAGAWVRKVGNKRLPHTFAWNEIARSGGVVAFGSDWSVVTLDPLVGLAVAISRQNGHGLPKEGWVAEQKLTFTDAVRGYTENAAWALHAENELGKIAEGRVADLVLLGRKVTPEEPLSFYWGHVELTIVDGRIVN